MENYCQSSGDTRPFSRVIGYMLDKNRCDWQRCYTNMAQPGVVSIRYNQNSGACVAIKECGTSTAQMQSFDNTGNVSNQSLLSGSDKNLSFGSCETTSCPNMPNVGRDLICNSGVYREY
jgi:hypothetical protein